MKFFLIVMLTLGQAYAQHSHHGPADQSKISRRNLNATDKDVVIGLLKKNDELLNAFLKKDSKGVEKIAIELNKQLSKSNAEVLNSTKKQASKLLELKATNSNEKNLVSYEQFLKPLVEVVKANDVGNKFNIFYCPMVKKSWIQDIEVNKDVKNVYAMDMLECGTQETHF
jgi:hypothetical protein